MASRAPQTPFDVRRDANRHMEQRVRGFREVQVRAYVRSRTEDGHPFPSYGEIKDSLGFYDRAGAYRVVVRLKKKGGI